MKRNLIFLTLLSIFLLTGCSSDDPSKGGHSSDGRGWRPSGINLKNPTALINYQEDVSRAIEGEFDRYGLYQLLPDGTIQTVAITFTTDEDGVATSHDNVLTISQASVFTTENYILLFNCRYYDKDGDSYTMFYDNAGSMPINENLVINKRTNKVYAFDGPDFWKRIEGGAGYLLPDDVIGEENGTLYLNLGSLVFRVTFSGNDAYMTMVNPGGFGYLGYSGGTTVFAEDNTILSSNGYEVAVIFSNGGYELVDNALLLSNGEILEISTNKITENGNEVTVSNVSVAAGKPIEKTVLASIECPSHIIYNTQSRYCYGKSNIVFQAGMALPLLVYNTTTKSLTLHEELSLTFNIESSQMYDGKCWEVGTKENGRGVEISWFDPDTLTEGKVPVDLSGIDVTETSVNYENGFVNITGVRRADSAHVSICINLATGKSEFDIEVPKNVTVTLTPLN